MTRYPLFDIIEPYGENALSIPQQVYIPFFGGIAQLARAFGSYPKCHWFKSSYRYQCRVYLK